MINVPLKNLVADDLISGKQKLEEWKYMVNKNISDTVKEKKNNKAIDPA